jgi:outer membrane protein assembly factor BamB/orotate phosphoribosyltransferase
LPEWEALRRQIFRYAIHFTKGLRFDFREMLSDPICLKVAGSLMWQLVKPYAPQVLIGPGLGAAPLLAAMSLAALDDGCRVNTLMVRDQRKTHNRRRWIEGQRPPDGSRCVIVDDFMEAGSALGLIDTAIAAEGYDLEIKAAALLFDMWQPLGSRQISVQRFPVVSLFRRHDIGLSRDCFDAQPPSMKGAFPPFIEISCWERFELNTNRRHPYKSSPVIADGAVFAADDASRVMRYNAATGDVEWTYKSLRQTPKGIVQRLQYADGSLVFGCYDGTVTRLDASTGAIRWRWRVASSVHATPTLDLTHGRLFVNCEQWNDGRPVGYLHALDWVSGRPLWRVSQNYWPPATVSYDARLNAVLAPCNDGTLICVDADSGLLRWCCETSGLLRGQPAIAGRRAFWATETGVVRCVDIATGGTLWERHYGKPLAQQSLVVHGDCVFVLDGKWHLFAFACADGALRWMSRLRAPGCGRIEQYGRYLIALSQGGQLAVFNSQTERKLWEGSIGGTFRQAPALGGGLLAAASSDDGLKVFRVNPFYDES